MTADASAKPRADDWVARFVALAKRMKMATVEPGPNPPRGVRLKLPEDKQKATEELGAILLPLRANLSQMQIEHLLFDDDPDVRLLAATTLGSKNDELRLSAITSALRGLSMEEVLANRRRARSKPLASPRLKDLNVDELLARLLDACERKTLADQFLDWGTNTADRKTCDQRLREVSDVQESLRARGVAERVAPLMDSENAQARMAAALICLEFDELKAVATLESVQKTGSLLDRGNARLLLVQLGKKPW